MFIDICFENRKIYSLVDSIDISKKKSNKDKTEHKTKNKWCQMENNRNGDCTIRTYTTTCNIAKCSSE